MGGEERGRGGGRKEGRRREEKWAGVVVVLKSGTVALNPGPDAFKLGMVVVWVTGGCS